MLKLTINGEKREFNSPLSLVQLLQRLELNVEQTAVAVNYQVISTQAYASVQLKDEDEIEVLTPHPGG